VDGAPAITQIFGSANAVALDSMGAFYFSNYPNRIYYVAANGLIRLVAGSGAPGYSGDGCPAIAAQLNSPEGIALDSSGNLYIADMRNHRIRKINSKGIISTVAGNGTKGYSGDGGNAATAQLNLPNSITVDLAGNLFFTDHGNHCVRKISPAGIITTVAVKVKGNYSGWRLLDSKDAKVFTVSGESKEGSGKQSLSPLPMISNPEGVAVDTAGNLYIPELHNECILKIMPSGGIKAIAGTEWSSGCSDERGKSISYMDDHNNDGESFDPLFIPEKIAMDAAGNLYTIDGLGNRLIRKITPASVITAVTAKEKGDASSDGSKEFLPPQLGPYSITVDLLGNLYIVDDGRIRKITPDGTIATVAGKRVLGFSGDGGPATSAQFYAPGSVALDPRGNLYIADTWNHRIRKVAPDGIITTVVGNGPTDWGGGKDANAQLYIPKRVAIDNHGNIYISDAGRNRIRKVTPAGLITTIAGNGTSGFSGDGSPAISAQFNDPDGIALDSSDNLYIADSNNNRIRKVTPAGIITTIAGNGAKGSSGDGGPAALAQLYWPQGVTVDSSGNLFVADMQNHRIRKVTPDGIITTIAGNGKPGFGGDSGQATSAQLNTPRSISMDNAGNLYIADTANYRIRKITPAGIITTIAGNGQGGFSGDGGSAVSAQLGGPWDMVVDSSGNLYIADTNRIRKVSPSSRYNSQKDPKF
jgi:sugar lactone lactonase YvrE